MEQSCHSLCGLPSFFANPARICNRGPIGSHCWSSVGSCLDEIWQLKPGDDWLWRARSEDGAVRPSWRRRLPSWQPAALGWPSASSNSARLGKQDLSERFLASTQLRQTKINKGLYVICSGMLVKENWQGFTSNVCEILYALQRRSRSSLVTGFDIDPEVSSSQDLARRYVIWTELQTEQVFELDDVRRASGKRWEFFVASNLLWSAATRSFAAALAGKAVTGTRVLRHQTRRLDCLPRHPC